MIVRLLTTLVIAGFAHGALLYGAPVSVLHVVAAHVATAREAAIVLGWLVLLYGTISAGVFVAVGVPLGLARRRRGAAAALQAALGGALAVYTVGCWFLVLDYGLTYDEIPWVTAPGRASMLVYLGVRVLPVIAVALALAGPVARWWLAGPHGARLRAPAGALLAVLAAHLAVPLWRTTDASGGAVVVGRAAAEDTGPAAARLDEPLKVVVVGIDGADWRVILPLLQQGRLPHVAELMRRGASGPLATVRYANSASIWASIYTGKTIAHHGVEDFYRIRLRGMRGDGIFPVHRTYLKELVSYVEPFGIARRQVVQRGSLRSPPLWEVVDRAGLSVGVVDGYYYSYPAFRPRQPESYVLAYGLDDAFRRAAAAGGTSAVPPEYLQPPALLADVAPALGRGELRWQTAAVLRLLAERPQPRLLSLYTRQPDVDEHRYWKWYEPDRFLGVDAAQVARLGDHIPRLYEEIDAFLGALVARLDERTVLMVVSDHGHSPTLLHAMYTQHRHGPPGVVLMAGGPVRAGARLERAHVLDVFPTVLHLLGLPVPEDGDGRVLVEAFEPAFAARAPVRVGPPSAPSAPPPAAGAEDDPQRNREEIEKLRALGYVR